MVASFKLNAYKNQMIIRCAGQLLHISFFLYAVSLLCGRVNLDRVSEWGHNFHDIMLAGPLLFVAFVFAVPTLIRNIRSKSLKKLSREPFIWLAFLVLLSGALTPALTGRGTLEQLIDFLIVSAFVVFPLLVIRDRQSALMMALHISFLCLLLPVVLLVKFGNLGTDYISPFISDFSFYRIMLVGFCATMVAAFLAPKTAFKIILFALGFVFLTLSLYTDNKAVTLAVFLSSALICIISAALCNGRFGVLMVLYSIAALFMSYALNPSAKVDRWISTVDPNHLTERELKYSEIKGYGERAEIYRHILKDAKRIESAVEGSTYVTMNDTTGRLRLWKSALKDVKFYPFLGHGYGTFKVNIRGYYNSEGTDYYHPHNLLIECLVSGGIIGLGMICLIICWTFVTVVRASVIQSSFADRSLAMVVLWTVLTLLIGSMFNGDVYDTRLIWVLGPLFVASLSVQSAQKHDA